MGVVRSTLVLAPVLAALLLAPLALSMPNPYGSELLLELHETSHTLLFFTVQLTLLFYLRSVRPSWRPFTQVLVATALSLTFGGAIELVQPFLQRSRSWADMGRNLLGVLSACGVFLAVTGPGGWRRNLSLAATGVIILGAFWPLLNALHRQTVRDRDFPLLMNFDHPATRSYIIRASRSTVSIEDAPEGWADNVSKVARVVMPSAAPWSGFVLRHPSHDWSAFSRLRFEVFSLHPETVSIGVNLYSAENRMKTLRYKSFKVAPGLNDFSMDLTAGAPLDEHHITSVSWYSITKGQDLELFFDNLRLE